jgi:hypothetical protein
MQRLVALKQTSILAAATNTPAESENDLIFTSVYKSTIVLLWHFQTRDHFVVWSLL